MALFVGDDWAEDHHDVAVMDAAGRVLAKARLPEGVAGMARVHALIGAHAGKDEQNEEVLVGIETERGGWVAALLAAGYTVYAVNPLQAARYRERHSVSGAKSDVADARMLADMVRTDAPRLRALAPDTALAEAVKVLSRAHKTLIWERTRHTQRLRHALLEYFPAVLDAFADLDAPDTLALLRIAPDPVAAAKLTRSQIRAVLKTARRRNLDANTTRIQAVLRGEYLRRDPIVVTAYAASTRASAAVLAALNTQITELEDQLHDHFGRHPDAEIYASQPGLGVILAARVLGEFGDDPHRYTDAKARKNY
ncbi:MAG TPA: IS110 family transposase, partial [Actinomycetota bacterium]|nr:IS110 family transposase [Actinomycetota bacterium]